MLNVDFLLYLLNLSIQVLLRQAIAFRQSKRSLPIANNRLLRCSLSSEVDQPIEVFNLSEHFLVFLAE